MKRTTFIQCLLLIGMLWPYGGIYALSPKGVCLYRFLLSALQCEEQTKAQYRRDRQLQVQQQCLRNAIFAHMVGCIGKLRQTQQFSECNRINPPIAELPAIGKPSDRALQCYLEAKKQRRHCYSEFNHLKKEERLAKIKTCLKSPGKRLFACAKKIYGKEKAMVPPYERSIYDYPLWQIKKTLKQGDFCYVNAYAIKLKRKIWQTARIVRIIKPFAILSLYHGELIKKPLSQLIPWMPDNIYVCGREKTNQRGKNVILPIWQKATILERWATSFIAKSTHQNKEKRYSIQTVLPDSAHLILAYPTNKQKKQRAIKLKILKAIDSLASEPGQYTVKRDKNDKTFTINYTKTYLPLPLSLKLTQKTNTHQQSYLICQPTSPYPKEWLPDFCQNPLLLNEALP